MPSTDPHIDRSGLRTFTGSQRLLRGLSMAFLVWCIFTFAFNIVLALLGFVFNMGSVLVSARLEDIVNAVVYLVIAGLNFALTYVAWRAANHPSRTLWFKRITVLFIVLNAASLVLHVVFRQFGGALTDVYSLILMGLFYWLGCQVEHEREEGLAVDVDDLPRTVSGKRIKTERALERAIEEGTLAA